MSETTQEAPPEAPQEPTEAPQEPEVPVEEPETPPEPETPEEPTEEPAAPEQQGLSLEELEKVRKKLDQSATTWRNRVSDLLGEEAQMLVPCELCDPLIPGFHWPPDVEQPRDRLHESLLEVLRTPGEPDYLEDPNTRQCGVCGGLGKTRTKGKVPGKTTRVCTTCKGIGFLSTETPAAPPTNGVVAESEFELPTEEPLVTEDADVWGSPRLLDDGMENPNYGKMPQYKDPSLP